MIRPEGPCQDCDARIEGCHGFCDRYTDYRKALDAYNEEVKKKKEEEFVPRRKYTERERKRLKVRGQR